MAIYKREELIKVVLATSKKSKGEGQGPSQEIPDDVIIEQVEGQEEEGEETDKSEEGKEEEGSEEKGGEKGEGEGEGEGEEGKGKGEGKGEGKGKGGSSSEEKAKDIDQIKKKAQELLDELKKADPSHHNCGSVDKRSEKQKEQFEKDPDAFREEEKFIRDRIKSIMEEAASRGVEHPGMQSRGRGEGKGSGISSTAKLVPIPMRKPEFLAKMKDFAEAEYEKERSKKDTDWLYTQSYENIVFKDRPKISIPRKAIYILVDVSGSMFGDFGGTGKSLLEHLIGYLPTIADDFVGQVWWMSDGILKWKKFEDSHSYYKEDYYKLDSNMVPGKEAINDLSFFKGKKASELSNFFECIKGAEGSGGGTVFNVELQVIQNITEKEGHNSPIICLSDGYIDSVKTEYTFPIGSKNKVIGKLPPNTIFMTDPSGLDYMNKYYSDDPKKGYFDYGKNIQYYDITDKGKFKVDLKSKRF